MGRPRNCGRCNKPKTKCDCGRPTVMTEKTISKLEDGFLMGFSDEEACLYANISTTPFYEYCKEYPKFKERKELLKKQPLIQAKENMAGFLKSKDKDSTKFYLERKGRDEFATRVEKDVSGGINIIRIDADDEEL